MTVSNAMRFGLYGIVFILPFYQPLRFVLGLDRLAPAIIAAWTVGLLFLCIIDAWQGGRRVISGTILDKLVVAFAFYSSLLMLFSDSTLLDVLNSIRIWIIPVCLYFVAASVRGQEVGDVLIKCCLIDAAITSVFYALEFYHYNFLGKGYFGWTEQMKTYVEGHHISEAGSIIAGFTYRRIAGFIGHNHATAFFMGFGSAGCFIRFLSGPRRNYVLLLMAIFMLLVTILSMARISIGATFIGIGVGTALVLRYGTRLRLLSFPELLRDGAKLTLVVAILFGTCATVFAFEFEKLFNAILFFSSSDQIAATLEAMAGSVAASGAFSNLVFNPLSVLTGLGFSPNQSITPAFNDDLYLVQLFSQYGLIGIGLFGAILGVSWKYMLSCLNAKPQGNFFYIVPVIYMLMLILTTVHSSTFGRIQLYSIFFVMLGLVNANYVTAKERVSTP